MHTFRNPVYEWLARNPQAIPWLIAGLVLLLLMTLPMIVYALPIVKVPLRYNMRNLQSRWKTTLVTALAFTMVTALLTVMLAFVKGMDRLTEGTGNPGNVMVLSDGATDEAFSSLPPFSAGDLPSEIQKEILQSSEKDFLIAQEVYVVVTYTIPNPSPGSRKRRFVQMRGLDNPRIAGQVHDVELIAGGDWPSKSGVRDLGGGETANEIVLGNGVARVFAGDLGKEILEPGDIVTLGPRKWYVTGVMKEANSAFGSEIWARDRPVQETFGRRNSYSTYVVRTANAEKAKLAAGLLKNLRVERNLQANTELAYYAKLSETSQGFSRAIYFVAFVMALGGIFGIMNTMYAAISQRSKDIGVLRLMGYRRWQILVCFQFESIMIALAGGVLGCVFTYLVFNGWTATSIVGGQGGGGKSVVLRLTVDASVIAIGMLFSLIMGAFGGFLPSFGAMRLRPLESLK